MLFDYKTLCRVRAQKNFKNIQAGRRRIAYVRVLFDFGMAKVYYHYYEIALYLF